MTKELHILAAEAAYMDTADAAKAAVCRATRVDGEPMRLSHATVALLADAGCVDAKCALEDSRRYSHCILRAASIGSHGSYVYVSSGRNVPVVLGKVGS